MRRSILFYIVIVLLFLVILLFFNRAYSELTPYTWMIIVVLLLGLLLMYTIFTLFRQQTQSKTKEKELDAVFNRINYSVVSVDTNWRYTFLNDVALSTHPLGKEETLGKVIWDVHPEMKGTIFWDKYHEAMQTRKVVEIESYYAPMDTWFSVKVYPSADGLTIFYKDITKNKKTEEKLIASEKRFRLLIENNYDIISLMDDQFKVFYRSPSAIRITGWADEEILHKDGTKNIHPDDREKAGNIVKELMANPGKTINTLFRNQHKDGHYLWVEGTVINLLQDEDVKAIVFNFRDVTERKKAEEKIKNINTELEEKVTERTGQLKKSNEELEAFSYSVSHDLRAPLRGALAFATILDEEYGTKLDDEAKRIISVIKDSTLKMGNLIDDLLAFSRLGKQGIAKVSIKTKIMVDEIVHELQQQNKAAKKISWNIHALPSITGDVNMIRQVWINLISNAIKYSANKSLPSIEIGSYTEKSQMVFYIKDNGVGFNEEYMDKLFKVFQRLHDTDEFEGTGVGLALVEKIISRHEGKVWAEGKEDAGASFYFSLPR